MPKLIDREAHAAAVLPAGVRLLATEGFSALSYRRVAAESGLTVSAVRNMWQTQQKLQQRTAISLRDTLFDPAPVADWDMAPDDYLWACLRALLPWRPEQVLAHQAWLAIRSAPEGHVVHQVSLRFQRTRLTRVAVAVAYVERLRQRKRGIALSGDYLAGLDANEIDAGTGVLLAVVTGLADAMVRTDEPVGRDAAERWVRRLRCGLLD